ncbi:MAG: hypothetical protein EXR54_07175 [Dehalococcoidia bacterium]|nr:hypothetical protein [Dehalococcoidia bacterium]MSQ17332.1 hypothetical protein [Dehalococcoidia bacterium]
MDLVFQRGDAARPKGHALAFFRVTTEPDKVYATYMVVLPVKADLTKYVPPFLASHLGSMSLSDFSAFAMPPVPEAVATLRELELLSQLRDDDLVEAGSLFSFDITRLMESVNQAVQAYSQLCSSYFTAAESRPREVAPQPGGKPLPAGSPPAQDRSYQVNEVLYGLMSEADKLADLSRLLGRLRFAQEGRDTATVAEVNEEISTLGRHLPDSFQVTGLLAAAQNVSARGSRLAQLYLERCFRLAAGDSSSALALEEQIRGLQALG